MTPHTVVLTVADEDMATSDAVRALACRIGEEQNAGRRVVAVLPAMGDTIDRLRDLAYEVSSDPDPRELDMLVTTGARISCALCAMALIDGGYHAVSLTGSQAGIITNARHGRATVVDVRASRVREALNDGAIVLVAGLQGVSTEAEVTALRSGGVGATAAVLADALAAELIPLSSPHGGPVR